MELPLAYINEMKALLGAEYEDYLASFEEVRLYGLRAKFLRRNWQKKGNFLFSLYLGVKADFTTRKGNALPSIPITTRGCTICRNPAP